MYYDIRGSIRKQQDFLGILALLYATTGNSASNAAQ